VAFGSTTALMHSLDAAAWLLAPQQEQGVSVQVTDQQSGPIVPKRHAARRDEADTSCSKSALQGRQIVDLEREPRRRDVVAGRRRGPASRGAGRSMRRAFRLRMKCCHLDHRTGDGIKLFLLPAAIEERPATENPSTSR
jgi:hypothetical protein